MQNAGAHVAQTYLTSRQRLDVGIGVNSDSKGNQAIATRPNRSAPRLAPIIPAVTSRADSTALARAARPAANPQHPAAAEPISACVAIEIRGSDVWTINPI